jgi:hypothetical protein
MRKAGEVTDPVIVVDSGFWSAFWPDLLATAVGVLGGGGAALVLDRCARQRTAHAQQREMRERQRIALGAVMEDLEAFKLETASFAKEINRVTTGVLWPIASWHAFGEDLARLESETTRRALFAYFARVEQLRDVIEYQHRLVANLPAAKFGSNPTAQETMLENCTKLTTQLLDKLETDDVIATLRREGDRLKALVDRCAAP